MNDAGREIDAGAEGMLAQSSTAWPGLDFRQGAAIPQVVTLNLFQAPFPGLPGRGGACENHFSMTGLLLRQAFRTRGCSTRPSRI